MHFKLFILFAFRDGRFSRSSYDRTGYQLSLQINWALKELNKLNNMIYAVDVTNQTEMNSHNSICQQYVSCTVTSIF